MTTPTNPVEMIIAAITEMGKQRTGMTDMRRVIGIGREVETSKEKDNLIIFEHFFGMLFH